MAHQELGFKLAEKIIADWGEHVTLDQAPQLSGKQLTFVVRSNTNAKTKNP